MPRSLSPTTTSATATSTSATHLTRPDKSSLSLDSPCKTPEASCGTTACYDTMIQECCSGGTHTCSQAHNCVDMPSTNGTIVHGCCAFGTACGTQCIDTAVSKCCAIPGGEFGTCPAGSDCCGDMCCDAGSVCARSTGGNQCWPMDGALEGGVAVSMSPSIQGKQREDKGPRVVEEGSAATTIYRSEDPRMSRSRRPSASIWVYVLLLLAPCAAALSEVSAKIDDRDDDIHAKITASLKTTTTVSTAVSTSRAQEVEIELVETREEGRCGCWRCWSCSVCIKERRIQENQFRHHVASDASSTSTDASSAAFGKACSRFRDLRRPTDRHTRDDNNLGLMPMVTAATPVQASTPAIRLSRKKKFKFGSGSGGSSPGVGIRPKAMTMLMLCVLLLLALTSAFLFW